MSNSDKWSKTVRREDHGLGIRRDIPTTEVVRLDHAIAEAATLATSMGVSGERFIELCEAAFDMTNMS